MTASNEKGNGKATTAPSTAAQEAMHEEEALGRAYDTRQLARLWPAVVRLTRPLRHKPAIVGFVAAYLLWAALRTFPPA